MTSTAIYHYVYRITNIKLGKHYYGARSSKVEPKLDLGIKYFSSSRDKDFKKDQKDNPQDYRYKVVGVYSSRRLTLDKEIRIHKKFNVGINDKFYNMAKQTSTKWDSTGKVTVKDVNGNTFFIDKTDSRILSGELVHVNTGRIHTEDVKMANSLRNSGDKNSMYGSHRTGKTNPFYGKTHTEESKKAMGKDKLGVPLSEDTKAKLRGPRESYKLVTCPHCGKVGGGGNMTRHHFINCKFKQS